VIPYRVLKDAASKWGSRAALVSERRGEVSFEALLERAGQLAGALAAEGLGKGDVLAVLTPNCIEFAELYLAAGAVGAIFQPLDMRFRGEELKNSVAHTGVKAIALHVANLETAGEAVADVPVKILVGGESEGWRAYEELLGSGKAPEAVAEVDEETDNAVFLFTSGSTGMIKCVPITWGQLDFFPEDLADTLNVTVDDRWVTLLPMSHISGPILVNLCIAKGCSCFVTNNFAPPAMVANLAKFGVTGGHTVPAFARMILMGGPQKHDLAKLRVFALMGTSVPAQLLVALEKAIPSVKAIQGYGLTETSPMLTLQPAESHEEKRGSIGVAMPNVEMRLVDDDGNDVAAGETGELIVRGPKVFKGYYGNEEITARVIRDGWFHTGDVARMDSDGFYFHLGRKDDVIITGGLKVYPAEVESALLRHPAVADTFSFGVPDEKRGSAVAAEIVAKPGQEIDASEVRKFLLEHLAEYKVPTRIETVEEIPRTPTGKPIRQAGR
jgi:acyl-CoA synthetase (AMP-forming)/AMP-acid ligase II